MGLSHEQRLLNVILADLARIDDPLRLDRNAKIDLILLGPKPIRYLHSLPRCLEQKVTLNKSNLSWSRTEDRR